MLFVLIAFLVSFFSLVLILNTRIANFALDTPNQRSLHTKLTPRTGGLAIMAGVLLSWLLMPVDWYWLLFPSGLMLVSFIDDMCHLSIKWRLLAQIAISAAFVMLMLPPLSGWLVVLLILMLTWMTNLYNFMDGSDGLAGGMALFGFASFAMAAWLAGDVNFAMMNAGIAAACIAFLIFNFHPAKIFMGDAGSIPLGFLAGSIGIDGWQHSIWPAWFPILVFSPFILDATTTLLKRQFAGEKIWLPHRRHYYQRLVQMGWGHRKTALAEYALMVSVGLTALLLLNQATGMVVAALFCWTIFYAVMMHWIDICWAKASINSASQ